MQEIISNIFQCMNSASHSTFSALRHRVFCTKSGCFQPAFTQKLKHKVPSRFQKSHAEISRRIYIWAVLSTMLSVGGTVMSLFEYVKIWGIFVTKFVGGFPNNSRESALGFFHSVYKKNKILEIGYMMELLKFY